MSKICTVKYLFSGVDSEEGRLAQQLQEAGINFVCAPTSGPVVLWVNGHANYGIIAAKKAADNLIAKQEPKP